MTQALDLTKPPQGGGLISSDMRNNLQSIASNNKGPVQPSGNGTIDGQWWVDDADGNNVKLYMKVGAVWKLIMTNLQDVPQPASGGAQVVHEQAVAAATWTIAHGLGKYPQVTVVDSTTDPAQMIIPDAVRYLDDDTVEITFNAAQAGRAFIN